MPNMLKNTKAEILASEIQVQEKLKYKPLL